MVRQLRPQASRPRRDPRPPAVANSSDADDEPVSSSSRSMGAGDNSSSRSSSSTRSAMSQDMRPSSAHHNGSTSSGDDDADDDQGRVANPTPDDAHSEPDSSEAASEILALATPTPSRTYDFGIDGPSDESESSSGSSSSSSSATTTTDSEEEDHEADAGHREKSLRSERTLLAHHVPGLAEGNASFPPHFPGASSKVASALLLAHAALDACELHRRAGGFPHHVPGMIHWELLRCCLRYLVQNDVIGSRDSHRRKRPKKSAGVGKLDDVKHSAVRSTLARLLRRLALLFSSAHRQHPAYRLVHSAEYKHSLPHEQARGHSACLQICRSIDFGRGWPRESSQSGAHASRRRKGTSRGPRLAYHGDGRHVHFNAQTGQHSTGWSETESSSDGAMDPWDADEERGEEQEEQRRKSHRRGTKGSRHDRRGQSKASGRGKARVSSDEEMNPWSAESSDDDDDDRDESDAGSDESLESGSSSSDESEGLNPWELFSLVEPCLAASSLEIFLLCTQRRSFTLCAHAQVSKTDAHVVSGAGIPMLFDDYLREGGAAAREPPGGTRRYIDGIAICKVLKDVREIFVLCDMADWQAAVTTLVPFMPQLFHVKYRLCVFAYMDDDDEKYARLPRGGLPPWMVEAPPHQICVQLQRPVAARHGLVNSRAREYARALLPRSRKVSSLLAMTLCRLQQLTSSDGGAIFGDGREDDNDYGDDDDDDDEDDDDEDDDDDGGKGDRSADENFASFEELQEMLPPHLREREAYMCVSCRTVVISALRDRATSFWGREGGGQGTRAVPGDGHLPTPLLQYNTDLQHMIRVRIPAGRNQFELGANDDLRVCGEGPWLWRALKTGGCHHQLSLRGMERIPWRFCSTCHVKHAPSLYGAAPAPPLTFGRDSASSSAERAAVGAGGVSPLGLGCRCFSCARWWVYYGDQAGGPQQPSSCYFLMQE